jgi:hypothetical protein
MQRRSLADEQLRDPSAHLGSEANFLHLDDPGDAKFAGGPEGPEKPKGGAGGYDKWDEEKTAFHEYSPDSEKHADCGFILWRAKSERSRINAEVKFLMSQSSSINQRMAAAR